MISRRINFCILFFLVLLSWSMVMLLGPLVGVIAQDFGLTNETAVGNITAIFLIVAGVTAFGWVIVEDRLARRSGTSRKNLLILATVLWAVGLYLSSIASDLSQLFAFQMISAVGFAAVTPLAFSIAMDLIPAPERAKAFGLLDVAGMLGAAGLGYLLPGLLVDSLPWGVSLILIATLGLVLAGLSIYLYDPPRGAQEQELAELVADSATAYDYRISKESLGRMVRNKTNFLFLVLNLILSAALGSISYYFIRMMVTDHGFSSSLAVLIFVAAYGSQAIGAIFWSSRADKQFAHSKRGKVKVLLQCLMFGPGFWVIAYSLTFTVVDISIILFFTALLAIGSFFLSALIAITFTMLGEINPPEMRTTVFSMNNLAQTLGRSLGILIVGILFSATGATYRWGFIVMAFVFFGAIGLALPLLNLVPKELDDLSSLLSKRAQSRGYTT